MAEKMTPVSRAISDALTGAYKRKRLTQDVVAARADMSVVTLQKKLAAKAPISATDLVVLAQAIGVDPKRILSDALEDLGVSEASNNVVPMKRVADMSDDEIEAIQKRAAIDDEELEQDEPDPT